MLFLQPQLNDTRLCKLKIKVGWVAQPVEHLPFKQRVPGSNPGPITGER